MSRENSLTKAIYEMEVGDVLEFPIVRLPSVQSTSSITGARYDRKYTTETFREKRIITVKRLK